jgi:hypothetical protein
MVDGHHLAVQNCTGLAGYYERQRKELVHVTGRNASFRDLPYPKPQENYQVATEQAFEGLSRQSREQLQWLGAVSCTGGWELPVLNDRFEVRLSSREVVTSNGQEVGPAWRILALHYLSVTLQPDSLSPQVTFDDLPTARSYGGIYRGRVIKRLCGTAGRQIETLRDAANSLGGRMTEGGDAAFFFDVFPRVQVHLIWHAPDDEFSASATLLLPANIESYFCAEDIVVMSESLVSRLTWAPY